LEFTSLWYFALVHPESDFQSSPHPLQRKQAFSSPELRPNPLQLGHCSSLESSKLSRLLFRTVVIFNTPFFEAYVSTRTPNFEMNYFPLAIG